VTYLSLGAVLYLHEQLILAYGGSPGLRDEGALKSALARPRSTFGGQTLYPSLFEKAAALFESLCLNHPFVDGNKRVAYAGAGLFLEFNGWRLQAETEEAVAFTLEVAKGKWGKEELRLWLEQHSIPKRASRKNRKPRK
jgi:death-on-curing protein